MKITKEWLQEKSACSDGIDWFIAQAETDAIKVLQKLIAEKQLNWANWTICRLFDYKQKIQYAVFAAKQVIAIYEKKYPDDKRPRLAIKAAKKCMDNPTKENIAAAYAAADAAANAAYAAANAAAYAAYAAYAAADAANAAADAAYAAYAADAAAYAAYAAYAAADAANAAYAANAANAAYAANAANAAYAAADAAAGVTKIKILNYGIDLLQGKENANANN